MIKNLITVVCATSPHRFNENNSMILFNYSVIKTSQFKDCRFIICADGINPKSDFNLDHKKSWYYEYLDSLDDDLPEADIIKSDNHIGLTKNYLQAWDKKKITTPFVLLINHDTVFTDKILNINILDLLKNFPDFVNILMFPRLTKDDMNTEWWRNIPIQNHKDYKSGSSWDECRISFGNQDNCCITKTDKFQSLVNDFYRPEITHFLEDSIQAELLKISENDIKSWEKFGGCIFPCRNNIHLDGQSKAGPWRQENCRGGENVWSDGKFRQQDEKLFQDLFKINKNLQSIYHSFLKKLLQDYKEKCMEEFRCLMSTASHILDLRNFLYKDLSVNEQTNASRGLLPLQEGELLFHLKTQPFKSEIFWEDNREDKVDNSNLILKITAQANTQEERIIQNGGHPKGSCEINMENLGIQPTDLLKINILEFSGRNPTQSPDIFENEFNLSFCEFTKDKILLSAGALEKENEEVTLNVKKNNGSNINYKKVNGIYEIKLSELKDCSSIIGFFCAKDANENYKTSWTFECEPFSGNPKYLNNLRNAYDSFVNYSFEDIKDETSK